MTTHEIRKIIQVYGYSNGADGARIDYFKLGNKGSRHILTIPYIQLFSELVLMGSIDDECDPEQFADYQLSQWDALSLVIRHEYQQAVEQEINDSDMGNAINKLVK